MTSVSLEEQNKNFKNTLYIHDNLDVLQGLNSNLVDLIYLDPPFNSKRLYNAAIGSSAQGASFKDIWTWQDVNEYQLDIIANDYPNLAEYIDIIDQVSDKSMKAYITYMAQRVIQMKRVLKDTGSIYYHCDPTAGHFVKLMMDCIFGRQNFRNEIVWHYQTGGASKKWFSRKHDSIYFYAKTDKTAIDFNEIMDKRTEKSLKRAQNPNGARITSNSDTKIPMDVWQIQALNAMSKERTGYPTQKPLALLDRIIKASCPVGGIVLDPFCGCATSCLSAFNNGRHYIGIDIEDKAVDILIARLTGGDTNEKGAEGLLDKPLVLRKPPVRTDVEIVDLNVPKTKNEIKKFLYKKQSGKCNGCGCECLIDLFDIDHIIPKAHGGGDYIENYQLLCRTCNVTKGDRPMKFLLQRVDRIRKLREECEYN